MDDGRLPQQVHISMALPWKCWRFLPFAIVASILRLQR